MKITAAVLNDFEALYIFWQKAGLKVYPYGIEKEKFDRMCNLHPELCLKLIDENNSIMGSVCGSFDGRSVLVNRLAVHPDIQKKGYGKKLVEKLEEIVKEKGLNRISLKVHKSNTKVLGFYKKLGYEDEGVIMLKKNLR